VRPVVPVVTPKDSATVERAVKAAAVGPVPSVVEVVSVVAAGSTGATAVPAVLAAQVGRAQLAGPVEPVVRRSVSGTAVSVAPAVSVALRGVPAVPAAVVVTHV
jgi:hypothetical protein